MKRPLIVLVALGGVATLGARDLVWSGAASTTWNASALNFLSGDTPMAFQAGDNVTFDDTASNFTVAMSDAAEPTEVTVDAANDYTWNNASGMFQQTAKITKRGTGILKFVGGSNGFTGVLDIAEGKVYATKANSTSCVGSHLGYQVIVRDGAELSCRDRNILGNVFQRQGANICLKEGGKLTFYADSGSSFHGGNSVRSLTLDGGTIECHCLGASDIRGIVRINDYIAVTGTTAQTLQVVSKASFNYQLLSLNTNNPVEFRVADVTGSADADLIVAQELARPPSTKDPAGYIKTGDGTLQMKYQPNPAYYPNGPIEVRSGTLQFAVQNALQSREDQTLYVGTNATLHYAIRNVSNGNTSFDVTNGQDIKLDITVDHGTFKINDPTGAAGHNYLGRRLYLDHANLLFQMCGASSGKLGALTAGELIDFKGETPYVLDPWTNASGIASCPRFHLYRRPATEFRVADITGDAAVDVTNNFNLVDFYDPYVEYTNSTAVAADGFCRSGLVKTGPGTLLLTSRDSVFTGDVDIREGRLELDRTNYTYRTFGWLTTSYLGNMGVEGRSINVWTNGTLAIRQRNMFTSLDGSPKNGFKTEVALRGGTIWLCRDNTTCFGKLRYEGGTFDYSSGNGAWGVIALTESLTVAGRVPLVLDERHTTGQYLVMGHTNVVFDIADVSGDPAADATVGLLVARCIQTNVSEAYRWGFTKRGPGTLRLNSTASATVANTLGVDGPVAVECGVLLVDAPHALMKASEIAVKAGGYLGGTGAVANVTLASGAGLAGTKDQKKALTISGDLTIPETGTIDLVVSSGSAFEKVRVPVATVSGAIVESSRLANWTVTTNGAPVVGLPARAWLRGSTIYAGHPEGLMIIFK